MHIIHIHSLLLYSNKLHNKDNRFKLFMLTKKRKKMMMILLKIVVEDSLLDVVQRWLLVVYYLYVLEQLVADEFCEREDKRVKRCGMYQSREHDFMLGSFDRLLVGEEAGLECKTTSAFNQKKWDEGDVPPNYYVQCQHYMMVSGLPRWYLACLVGGNHFVSWTVERDEEDIDALRAAERDFWQRVVERIPPSIDGSDSSAQALRERFAGGQTEPVPLPTASIELISRYSELKQGIAELTAQAKEIQNQLCGMLGDNEVGLAGETKVCWKTIKGRTTIDSKRLKAEQPEVFAQYSKVGNPSRRFSITE